MNSIALPSTEVKYGPLYNSQVGEYEIWHQGSLVAWASTHPQAIRSYHEILTLNREHITRNPANRTNGDTPPSRLGLLRDLRAHH